MTNRIDRLPKWASAELEQTKELLRLAEKERDQLRAKSFGGTGKIVINNYGRLDGAPNTSLADAARIKFTEFTDENGEWIEVSHGGDHVRVMASNYSLVVRPSSSNVVELMVIDV